MKKFKCTQCGNQPRKIKWEITSSYMDPLIEVEQTFYQCESDGANFIIEIPTGKPSKYAEPHEPDSYYVAK